MKKPILMCFFVFAGPVLLLAEPSQDSAKDMAVIQIYQYAESSYDRGDYTEARHGFEKVLQLDPQNAGAAEHLKKMESVMTTAAADAAKEAKSDESVRTEKIEHSVESFSSTTSNTTAATTAQAPMPAGDDIKDQIAAEDRAIGQLNDELARLRASTETPHE